MNHKELENTVVGNHNTLIAIREKTLRVFPLCFIHGLFYIATGLFWKITWCDLTALHSVRTYLLYGVLYYKTGIPLVSAVSSGSLKWQMSSKEKSPHHHHSPVSSKLGAVSTTKHCFVHNGPFTMPEWILAIQPSTTIKETNTGYNNWCRLGVYMITVTLARAPLEKLYVSWGRSSNVKRPSAPKELLIIPFIAEADFMHHYQRALTTGGSSSMFSEPVSKDKRSLFVYASGNVLSPLTSALLIPVLVWSAESYRWKACRI